MKIIFAILISISVLFSAGAANNSLTDEQLLQIKFDQRPGAEVSPGLTFRDETGKQVHLGDYFGKRPLVLMLGYYGCPMLCTLTLNGATESFRNLKWSIGKDFDVVFVSIDPNEASSLAAAKKKTYVRDYGRADSATGWHFLVASRQAAANVSPDQRGFSESPPRDNSIQTLADEVGFHYAYDAGLKQFAHPSGFVILTPDGKVSRYFFGINFSPAEVDAALRGASVKKISSPVAEFILLCCEYSPFRGKYGTFVMDIVRGGGVVTIAALGVFFVRSGRRKSSYKPGPANGRRTTPAVTNQ